ncbi:threonine synthase [Tenacibaculum sp. SG-28]|uniref:threonine synthase n=1 Tax=Tenacibaculum sp. SG-28 TaxID=754426 RepID=UPI000CF4B55A|nr:threonine synthase [Tenacibaculum sp. SG-28]PQJ22917.1 threonine synthase [Tenacibaculum sp. SG-28]
MHYYSLHKKSPSVSFKEAVVKGLAPDRGLYFPEHIEPLPKDFIQNLENYSEEEIAFKVIQQFVGNDIPKNELKKIIADTLSFEFPVVPIEDNIGTLELFHGPTMAFKDVGARFMARCLAHFYENSQEKVTVLVATSGDTGGAVANGFLGVEGVEVVILYPSGKVSTIQEKQLTTLGQNITALEVDGVFDDCQEMVKTAFLDQDIEPILTSANSINIARWLPQMFYFFFAYKQVYKKNKEIVFSVPSGNFGNICAGVMAQRLGLPIQHFIASTNSNDTISRYLENGKYLPNPSKATISNAMDVGNPSNFIRIQELFQNDLASLKKVFSSFAFNDTETIAAMRHIYTTRHYIADPHGAVGYLGCKAFQKTQPNSFYIFLETAHPVKFLPVVEDTLQTKLVIPEQIKAILPKEKKSIPISSYDELKTYLNTSSKVTLT